MSTKIYITTVGENEITVSLNGEAAVTKTIKPTLTALGNTGIRFECDDIDEIVETYRHIFINEVPLKGSWISEEDYLAVALFEAVMNKTFVSSGSPGGSGYLVYTALLTQEGTSAPSVIPLQNTIGEIVWTRAEAGLYRGTLTGAFPTSKTWCITPAVDIVDSGNIITIWAETANNISIATANNGTQEDDILSGQPIEIRVYP